jgi:acetylornithine deacetylase
MSEPGPARLDAAEILRRLVAFDTVSARSNLDLIRWVADYLDGHGVAATLTYDEHRQKANLFATIGPADRGGVILSGHTDVVPVEGQGWDSDPFALAERDGRLYGRGTADMKGFIAAALAAVPGFRAASLKTPIHLAFSYDEEVGCFGVPRLIEALPEGEARPKLVIIGEPTSMRVVSQHKGCTVFATTVTGAEQHSSATHRGVNAIAAAAEIVAEIERVAAEKRTAARPDSGFVPPYTTLSVGTIGGGTAQNIIPRHCRLTWEYRIAPWDDAAAIEARVAGFVERDLLPRMRQVSAAAAIAIEKLADVPPLAAAPGSPAEELARQLTGDNATHAIAFASEAGMFQRADIPAVVCGPGSIDQAHQPNEFIEVSQLEAGSGFMARLTRWASA